MLKTLREEWKTCDLSCDLRNRFRRVKRKSEVTSLSRRDLELALEPAGKVDNHLVLRGVQSGASNTCVTA